MVAQSTFDTSECFGMSIQIYLLGILEWFWQLTPVSWRRFSLVELSVGVAGAKNKRHVAGIRLVTLPDNSPIYEGSQAIPQNKMQTLAKFIHTFPCHISSLENIIPLQKCLLYTYPAPCFEILGKEFLFTNNLWPLYASKAARPIWYSKLPVHSRVKGSLVGLGTTLCGLHSLCSGRWPWRDERRRW